MDEIDKNYVCSFCGKELTDNEAMIGINAAICNSCVDIYYHIMELAQKHWEVLDEKMRFSEDKITPQKVYQELSKKVIGQDQAKKVLSVALYNHYKRLKQGNIEKSNILMIGPTGSGKTLLAKSLAEILKVPFAIVDATVYTEAGYVGEDVENMLLKLLQNADYDQELAEKGIIFIDEIDKIARKSENVSITRDVSGEGVQNSLLKIIEGSVVNISPRGGRKHPYQEYISFDTSNVLFICAGAFEGMNFQTLSNIGFVPTLELMPNIDIVEKLTKAGMIPELLGRLPVIVNLDSLTVEDLENILLKTENSLIKQYQQLLEMDNVELEFSKEAISTIAVRAYKEKTGARSLRRIMEQLMLEIMFNIPEDGQKYYLLITPEMIKKQENKIKFELKTKQIGG